MSYKPPYIDHGSRLPPGVYYPQQLMSLPHGPLSPPYVGQGMPSLPHHLTGGLSPPGVSRIPEMSYRYLAPSFYSPQLRLPGSEPVGYLPSHLGVHVDCGYLADPSFPRHHYSLGDYIRTEHALGSPPRMTAPLIISPDEILADHVMMNRRETNRLPTPQSSPSAPLPTPPILQRAPERYNTGRPPPLTRAPEHIIPLSSSNSSGSSNTATESNASMATEDNSRKNSCPIVSIGESVNKDSESTVESRTENAPLPAADREQDQYDNNNKTTTDISPEKPPSAVTPSFSAIPTVVSETLSASTLTKTSKDFSSELYITSASPALSESSTSTSFSTLAELSPTSSSALSKEEVKKRHLMLDSSAVLDMTPGVLWTRPHDGRHQCNLCNYATPRLDKMEQHLIAHKGKLICDGCGKAFIKVR